jgi:hypothetical protein
MTCLGWSSPKKFEKNLVHLEFVKVTMPPSTFHLRTELTDVLGIINPIICPPMAGASCPTLVSAVNKSGGIGFLAVGWFSSICF